VSGRIDLKSVRLKTAQKYSNWLLFYLFFQKQAPFSVLSAKGSSTFLTKPLFPQEREDVTALRCSEPLRYKVGGPIKGLARLCGMGPPGYYLLMKNAWLMFGFQHKHIIRSQVVNPTLLLWLPSRVFGSSPCSRLPSGRDRRDRTRDNPLPCCPDSPLSASSCLWCCDTSSAKNEADCRTGCYGHNPLRHA